MRGYRFVWGVTAAVATGCGAASLIAAGEWLATFAVTLMLASFAAMVALTFCEDPRDRWRWATRTVVWTCAGTVAWSGLVTWGAGGALVVMGLGVTHPALLTRLRALVLDRVTRRTVGPPETLGTRELLRRWEWTTNEVLRGTTPPQRRVALVEERGRLLDELERREPTRFIEWASSAVPDRVAPRRLRP